MSKHALILLRNDASLAISVTPEAIAAKAEALADAQMVQVIANPRSQDVAVAAQAALRVLINACETSRKDVKAPVLDYGRIIDQTAKDFSDALKAEEMRLAKLIGDYQALEAARVRAEEAARNEELTRLERERAAELSLAKSHEQREAIQERFHQEVQAVPPPPVAARADGQVVRTDHDFEVTDVHLLYRHHPSLVKLEAKRSEIKEAIRNLKKGETIQGIRFWEITKSSVRT